MSRVQLRPALRMAARGARRGTGYLSFLPSSAVFTPALARRNGGSSAFDTGLAVQGGWANGSAGDTVTVSRGAQISGSFYANFDANQGWLVCWLTPEWDGDDAKSHYIMQWSANGALYKHTDNKLYLSVASGVSVSVDVSAWAAGTTYAIEARWDADCALDASDNHLCLSIDDSHTFGRTTDYTAEAPSASLYVGTNASGNNPVSAVVEGLTVYRRPGWDGTNGINMWGVDELALTADKCETTGSWDVVFCLPTNTYVGTESAAGTEHEAWSHPHGSNILTDGYCQTTYASSAWDTVGSPTSGPEDMAATEKIYGWGYKWEADASGQGVAQTLTGLTYNACYVVRPVVDSTVAATLNILDATNSTTIASFTLPTGTRTAPAAMPYLCFEVPMQRAAFGQFVHSGQPSDTETVTIGTTVYTYKDDISSPGAGAIYVKIGASAAATADNLRRAITDAGTLDTNYSYGAGAGAHATATAALGVGTHVVIVTAKTAGVAGNAIALESTAANVTRSAATLEWGCDANCTSITVQVLSTDAQTIHLHQLEVLPIYLLNAGGQRGRGDPFLPDGWANVVEEAGWVARDFDNERYGVSCTKLTADCLGSHLAPNYTSPSENPDSYHYFASGNWGKLSETPDPDFYIQHQTFTGRKQGIYNVLGSIVGHVTSTDWQLVQAVMHTVGEIAASGSGIFMTSLSNGKIRYAADAYVLDADMLTLTLTPANAAASAEGSGLRVDGLDACSQTVRGLGATSGTICLSYTARHAPADVAKFGAATPYILDCYGDANNYIRLYWSSASTLTLAYNDGGGAHSGTISGSGFLPGTAKTVQISYSGDGMVLSVDGYLVLTLADAPSFATVPTTVYWGQKNDGTCHCDAVFAEAEKATPISPPSLAIRPDAAAGIDTRVDEHAPDGPGSTHTRISLWGLTDWRTNGLLKFDFSSLPEGSVILSATLSLWNDLVRGGTATVTAHRILPANSGWTEGATWNYAIPSSQRWAGDTGGDGGADAGCSVSGADYSATALGASDWASSEPVGTRHDFVLNVAEVEAMRADNHGLVLFTAATARYADIATSDHPTESVRPMLTLTYF